LEEEWAVPAGRKCSSYSAELTAMREATGRLMEREEWQSAQIITDSLSLVQALGGESRETGLQKLQQELWTLRERGKRIEIVWVPGHCGLEGNERADEMARRGGQMEQTEVRIDRPTRDACVRRLFDRGRIQHDRIRQVYAGGVREEEEERELTREQQVNLGRFRSGHHPKVRRWMKMVGSTEEDRCRLCDEAEETCEHLWMECPALARERWERELGENMGELTRSPVLAMALLSIILSRLR
jgi:ribonuclease HI